MREPYTSVTTSPAKWSAAATIDHFGGDEKLVRELVGLFLDSCPRLLDALRARFRDGDLVALGRAAHALKGSLSNFTREAPTTTALELERLCGVGRRDAAEAMMRRLEGEVARLVADMRAFQNAVS